MAVTTQFVKEILETLPVGYYLGTRAEVIFEESGSSYCNPMDNTIHVSGANVIQALSNLQTSDPAQVDASTRAILYHEVGHLLLTPKIKGITSHYNIFEDERLETILAHFFLNVNFKANVFALNGWTPDYKPQDAEQFYYEIVRFRHGPKQFVDKVGKLIHRYHYINATSDSDDYRRYLADEQRFWEEVRDYWNEQQQNQQNQQQQQNQQGDGQQDQQGQSGNQDQQQGQSNGNSDDQKDQQNGQQGQSGGSNQQGEDQQNQTGSGSSQQSGDQNGQKKPNQNGQGNDGQQGNSPEAGDNNQNPGSDNGQTNESDSGNDGSDSNSPSDADGDDEEELKKAIAKAIKDAMSEMDKQEKNTVTVTRESISKLTDRILHQYQDATIIADLERIIIRNNKKKAMHRAMHSPFTNGYSGKIDPRSVAMKRDFRWFIKKGDSGSGKFNRTHITLWVDTSGSFSDSIDQVNKLIFALTEMQRRLGKDFSFDVVSMDERNTICSAKKALRAGGCNHFGPGVEEIVRKLTKTGWENYNILVWDGDLESDVFNGESEANRWAKAFQALNNNHTVITSDSYNSRYLNRHCGKARIKYIDGHYAAEFVKEVIALLDRAMG